MRKSWLWERIGGWRITLRNRKFCFINWTVKCLSLSIFLSIKESLTFSLLGINKMLYLNMLTHRKDSLLSPWINCKRLWSHRHTWRWPSAWSKRTTMHDLLELLEDAVWCANIGRWVFFRGVVLTSMYGPDTSTLPSHSLPSKHVELMTFFSRAWSGQSSPNGHSLLYRKWASSVPSYR